MPQGRKYRVTDTLAGEITMNLIQNFEGVRGVALVVVCEGKTHRSVQYVAFPGVAAEIALALKACNGDISPEDLARDPGLVIDG